ncbi:eukaryotic translation initiation factor 3 subunit G isoform X1 [Octopus sinensis]|uniref:Eukaryotic translation initiation factor 3 subunit G n=1 Tax=Octopus sinensis TaxID=2607531 RepID=A0A6P7U0N9_9MOLL|nr:eukaryotic translation initiation factor 3 subunit G isoform X1 [Octopus sinensis]
MAGKLSWAEQVEHEDNEDEIPLVPGESGEASIEEKDGLKKITEVNWSEDLGKHIKVVKSYRVETKKLTKSIARRKQWKKFGSAESDPPGPNPANTIISEDIFMSFLNSKEHQIETDDDPLLKIKSQKIVTCRICKGDHWTTRCPYKDTLQPLQDNLKEGEKKQDATTPGSVAGSLASKSGKYVPPSLRDGANKGRGESMNNSKRDDFATIRVTNLSEDTREADLQELFRPFGTIHRIYLAKDKNTCQSKGFAFINFHRREDAARAILGVSGYGYDHLILNVEWAKPSVTS